MPRLTIAFCLLVQAFAQQEPVGKKIADPAAAATDDGALYELMKAEYLAEACEDAGWGPFPNSTSTSLSVEAYARAHGTSGCKCGMLYCSSSNALSPVAACAAPVYEQAIALRPSSSLPGGTIATTAQVLSPRLPWRDRRHLAHVLPPSLSFVLDVS